MMVLHEQSFTINPSSSYIRVAVGWLSRLHSQRGLMTSTRLSSWASLVGLPELDVRRRTA